jgi:hypothetical protein
MIHYFLNKADLQTVENTFPLIQNEIPLNLLHLNFGISNTDIQDTIDLSKWFGDPNNLFI